MAPHFIHDCDQCQFLGRFYRYDLYVCPTRMHGFTMSTVIVRFGSQPEAYTSGLGFARSVKYGTHLSVDCFSLYEAYIRAQHMGYVDERDPGYGSEVYTIKLTA